MQGDINADGFDDVIVGAPLARSVGNTRIDAGESYVVFGGASMPASIDFATLASSWLALFGVDASDKSARVSAAGDVNGDGFDDVIVGAPFAQAASNTTSGAGESYIVFGGNSFTNSILAGNLGTSAANTINGTSAANIINGADGNDTLIGLGGADVLIGGRGDDVMVVSDTTFRRIVGGNGQDRLQLNGAGLTLDLNARADNRILGVESIDITGTGNNTLVLNRNDVLNISDKGNALLVRGNAGDMVGTDTGWTQIANEVISGETYQVFQNGTAVLRVLQGVAVRNTIVNLGTSVGSGTTVFGQVAGGASGRSVSDVGDVNGDGFDDVVIGAHYAYSSVGRSYLIFGGPNQPATIDLSSLGSAGTVFPGIDVGDASGSSVSAAGDINADGFDDILIGVPSSNGFQNLEGGAGEVYVVFGAAVMPPAINMSSLGSLGIKIFGADSSDTAGTSVSSAGDVNADGYDDLLIGAPTGDGAGNAKNDAGETYIIFGGNALPSTIDLAALGSAGTTIYGRESVDRSGWSVSSAGDVNGDGFGDVVIGAYDADGVDNLRDNSGESYVIFGGGRFATDHRSC